MEGASVLLMYPSSKSKPVGIPGTYSTPDYWGFSICISWEFKHIFGPLYAYFPQSAAGALLYTSTYGKREASHNKLSLLHLARAIPWSIPTASSFPAALRRQL